MLNHTKFARVQKFLKKFLRNTQDSYWQLNV